MPRRSTTKSIKTHRSNLPATPDNSHNQTNHTSNHLSLLQQTDSRSNRLSPLLQEGLGGGHNNPTLSNRQTAGATGCPPSSGGARGRPQQSHPLQQTNSGRNLLSPLLQEGARGRPQQSHYLLQTNSGSNRLSPLLQEGARGRPQQSHTHTRSKQNHPPKLHPIPKSCPSRFRQSRA